MCPIQASDTRTQPSQFGVVVGITWGRLVTSCVGIGHNGFGAFGLFSSHFFVVPPVPFAQDRLSAPVVATNLTPPLTSCFALSL
jgi:hypothetical protein